MVFLRLPKMIIFLLFLLSTFESKLIGIESINSDKYFVVLDTGIFLYYHDFSIKTTIWDKQFDKIIYIDIIKHLYNEKAYFFLYNK